MGTFFTVKVLWILFLFYISSQAPMWVWVSWIFYLLCVWAYILSLLICSAYNYQICLEILNFASYSGDTDSRIVRETWAKFLDQALSRGGIAEACSVLKRVGHNLYPGDGAFIPLDALCLHLEKKCMVRYFYFLPFLYFDYLSLI